MAAINLLPGFGDQYSTTFSAVSVQSVGSDTIDCSKCHTLAITLSSNSTGPASSNIIFLQQSFDGGTGWVNIGTSITAASAGVYSSTSQPFGMMRLRGSVGNGTLTVTMTGFPQPRSW